MSTQRFNEKDGGDGLKEPLDALLHASLHRRDALQTESLRTGLNQRGRRASMRSFEAASGNQAASIADVIAKSHKPEPA